MNKLAIPAILAATVLVAGIFAFMPVQQASTVHTTIIGVGGLDLDDISNRLPAVVERAETIALGAAPDNDILAFTCDQAFTLLSVWFPDATDSADSQLGIDDINVSADGTAATTANIGNRQDIADNGISDIELLNEMFSTGDIAVNVLSAPANGEIQFTLLDADSSAANDSIDIRAYFQTQSNANCDITLTAG